MLVEVHAIAPNGGLSDITRTTCAVGTATRVSPPGRRRWRDGGQWRPELVRGVLDEVSFDAAKLEGQTIEIDAKYVDDRLAGIAKDDNLSQYIL